MPDRVEAVRFKCVSCVFFFFCRKDDKEYALKQIEGTGISMSACREIAVRVFFFFGLCRGAFQGQPDKGCSSAKSKAAHESILFVLCLMVL